MKDTREVEGRRKSERKEGSEKRKCGETGKTKVNDG